MERSTRIIGAVLAVTTTSLAAPAFAEPVLVNGGFEAPAFEPGTINFGQAGDGWVKSFMGAVQIINGNAPDPNGGTLGTTPFGAQYLGLGARSNGFIARDSQTVDGFVAGQTYALSAYFADALSGPDPTLDLSVFAPGGPGVDDVVIAEQTYTAPVGGSYGDGVIPFVQATLLFTPDISGALGLSLTNASGFTAGTAISVDNVTLTSVPEPATAGLALLGAGLLTARRRRRA